VADSPAGRLSTDRARIGRSGCVAVLGLLDWRRRQLSYSIGTAVHLRMKSQGLRGLFFGLLGCSMLPGAHFGGTAIAQHSEGRHMVCAGLLSCWGRVVAQAVTSTGVVASSASWWDNFGWCG